MLVQPSLLPKSSTIIRLRVPTMNTHRPRTSNERLGPTCSTLLSGVPVMSRNAMIEMTIEAMKIPRQPPAYCTTAPPNRAERPEPPQEPIDHIETARWRCVRAWRS